MQLAELAMGLNPGGLKPDPVLGPLGLSSSKDGSQPSSFGIARDHVRNAEFQGNTL